MNDLGWSVTLALLAGMAVLETVTRALRRRCVEFGHDWRAERGGFRCRRCWQRFFGVVIVLLCAASAHAEDPLLAWPTHRPVANWISNGLLGVQIGADTWHSFKAERRGRAFANQGCRNLIAWGSTALSKRFIPRARPDGSDNKSFWSGHTAHATAAAGWRFDVGIPIAAGVAVMRGGAAKHYLSDVGVGALDGVASYWACRWIN